MFRCLEPAVFQATTNVREFFPQRDLMLTFFLAEQPRYLLTDLTSDKHLISGLF